MINIIEINEQKTWDDFVTTNTSDTFLQSWAWGEFNQSIGNKIWRFGLLEESKIISMFLVVLICAKRGRFLFVPHGPVINTHLSGSSQTITNPSVELTLKKIFSEVFKKLIETAEKETCSFIRIAPTLKKNDANEKILSDLGLIKAPIHVHSELSWILDISTDEEKILSEMRKTTRYLINQNKKHGLVIEKSTDIKDIDKFYRIYQETEKRQKFMAFTSDYIKKEYLAFAIKNEVLVYFANYQDEVLSCAFVIKYGNSGFYHHGATSNKQPKIPSSYILQWEIIKDLRKQGLRYYNFWGIAPEEKTNHPWRGLTLFKKGFGGFEKEYLATRDYVLKPSYWLNWTIESVRRIKRRY